MKANEAKQVIASASNSPSLLGKFSGKSCDSNVFNSNDMHLGKELFENIIASEEYKDAIERGHYIGFLGHPEDPACQEFQNACIVMTSMSLDDNGEVSAEFNLINTPVGQIVKAFVDAGVKFGISIRGAGDVGGDGEVDPDTFIFRGFDLVAFPAYNDCVPVFQEIAASADIEEQKKYKKICATVKKNLKSITSSDALCIIKDQMVRNSDPYKQVESRIEELCEPCCNEELCDLQDENIEDKSFEKEQLDIMVDMYSEALEKIECLESEVNRLDSSLQNVTVQSASESKKLKVMKRIHASQIEKLDNITAEKELLLEKEHKKLVEASREVKSLKLAVVNSKKLNLNYSQKIITKGRSIKQKELEIENLNSKLRETVTASKELKAKTSNYDAQIASLNQKVQAAEDMVYSYQKAYANIYANALGKEVSNISVTTSTSPEELRKVILGGTSTVNIPAKPEYSDLEEMEYFGDDEEVDSDTGIVSI